VKPPLLGICVRREFPVQSGTLEVLRGVDVELAEGEIVAIEGPSGSGKSTLLHILAGLDRPTSGEVWWGEVDAMAQSGDQLALLRHRHIGLMFQRHHLLADLTLLENVTLAGRIRGGFDEARGLELLARLGLADRAQARAATLSGGELGRAAAARALFMHPKVILADEPTANLDADSAVQLIDALVDTVAQQGVALLLVTHDPRVAVRADRRLRLDRGVIASL